MTATHQTAYPRIKSDITQEELGDVYTLTPEDQRFALRHCKRSSASFLGLMAQLKTTQRLGRFVSLGEIPKVIIAHIKNQCRSRVTLKDLQSYYSSGAKDRHVKLIRRHLNIKASQVTTIYRSWFNSTKSSDLLCFARLKYSIWHRPRKTRTCLMLFSLS